MLSSRFRAMYRNLGLSRLEAAQLLHVSERTLHNWDTGHHEIPYSAYRLLRLLTRQELPGKAWAGWHITVGVLWSPEGHGFKPEDSSWWSMLCRRSAQFHSLYAENNLLKRRDAQATRALEVGLKVDVPVTRHFSLTDETFTQKTGDQVRKQVTPHQMFTGEPKTPNLPHYENKGCPADTRLIRVRFAQNLLKGGV